MIANKLPKIGVLFIFLLLGWLVYLAFQEYSTESRVCLERGGKIEYDADTKTLYCNLPKKVKKRNNNWWSW